MRSYSTLKNRSEGNNKNPTDVRIRIVGVLFICTFAIVVVKLFMLMVLQHDFYTALASGAQEASTKLIPRRGEIFFQDSRTGEEFPLAINRDMYIMFADTREIKDDKTAEDDVLQLAQVFSYSDDRKNTLKIQLNKRTDAYEPIEKKVDDDTMNKVKQMQLVGIHFVRVPYRYYPEEMLASQVIGFVGKDENGNDIGRYGAEGYWNNELAGSGGFFEGTKSAKGSWITLAGSLMKPAVDGADMVLTIDRTLQFKACEKLLEAQTKYGAQSSALIIMEPQTGAIRAMCSFPTFDPNEYNKVQDAQAFNNSAIFTPYEPGSIFKPIAMSGVLNEKIANPETPFFDSGSSDAGCTKVIKNADLKAYGAQTMTGILQHSINTGMVYVANLLGKQKFLEYINNYGFGTKTGLELDVEASGTVQNLYQNKGNKIDCYTATAAFGQGITVTPLQMVNAYSAIANGGILMKPYIVGEVRYSDGRIEKTKPKEIRRVIEKKYASLLSAMLVRVVDFEATLAHIPGYFMAGKTGTAQIPGPGGYTDDKNHSYVGFGPVDDPKFVMIIKFEKPTKEVYSSMTAAPTFKDIAQFILQYYQIPPSK